MIALGVAGTLLTCHQAGGRIGQGEGVTAVLARIDYDATGESHRGAALVAHSREAVAGMNIRPERTVAHHQCVGFAHWQASVFDFDGKVSAPLPQIRQRREARWLWRCSGQHERRASECACRCSGRHTDRLCHRRPGAKARRLPQVRRQSWLARRGATRAKEQGEQDELPYYAQTTTDIGVWLFYHTVLEHDATDQGMVVRCITLAIAA